MKVRFDKLFYKDLEKNLDKSLAVAVKTMIVEVESANSLIEIRNLKKLKGFKNAYRIRLGDYRIGILTFENDTVDFIRILHRKEIYKFFP